MKQVFKETIEKIIENKFKVLSIIAVLIILIIFIICVTKLIDYKINNIDISNAIHGVVINNTNFYKKPKESKWKLIKKISAGENAYIVDEIIDENNQKWYKVKIGEKAGYVKKETVKYFEFSNDSGKVLMSDVSKFNIQFEHFKNSGDYEVFIVNNDINYVYIRAGGRGYGEEGKMYTDSKYSIFVEACEYLGVPYGFYYIDEALNTDEINEEVNFIESFLKENKKEYCKLPVVIDIESHNGEGRADSIWDERSILVSELILKFKEKNIDTIIYSNASTADKYLSEVNSKFWLAYYDKLKKVPNYWYTETDQNATSNELLMNNLVGWQFTETGAGKEIDYPVDLSLVDNNFFKNFVK